MPTPSIQTLVNDAQSVLALQNMTYIRSVMAVALANANTGTPLSTSLTNQQLINEARQVITLPKSDIESIIVNQMMKFLAAPPAPGGVGADKQVIWNDAGVLAGDPNFTWDGPLSLLNITGSATITGDLTVRTTGLVVNASGLGVGVSPSAWNSNYNAIDIGANGSIAGQLGASNTVDVVSNAFRNSSGNWVYKFNGPASRYQADGSTGAHFLLSAATGTAGATISWVTALALNLNGALALNGGNAGANGVGIAFPSAQSASTDANTLDDYEEGTFTPTVVGNTTPGTATYSEQTGKYTKVGRLVTFNLRVTYTGGTGAGFLRIAGLPFATGNVANYSIYAENISLTAGNYPVVASASGVTSIGIDQLPTGGGAANSVAYDAAGDIWISGSYIV